LAGDRAEISTVLGAKTLGEPLGEAAMRQPFKDLSKAEWEKQKLHYEALIGTESYRILIDKAFTKWAKDVNLDLNQCELTAARKR
jgi:hypothetical protein